LPIALGDKQICLELDDPLRRLDILAPFIQIESATDDAEDSGPSTAGH
jgi:hypothetical protein